MKPLKIVFAGTPDFAAVCLQQLLQSEHQVVGVYTQPDRRAGRGKKLLPGPVKQLALEHQLAIEQPVNFKQPEEQQKLASFQADLMVVVAYGLLLPQSVLDIPRLGCINVHASLLPRWRGAAPIQRAIEAGDKKTGVGIMQMEAGLDTGPLWRSAECDISASETGASLHDKLAELGADTLLNALPDIAQSISQPQPQNSEGVLYAHKLEKAEAHIDWQQDADAIERKVRAFNSWPVAFFNCEQQTIRVWQAHAVMDSHNKDAGQIIRADKAGIQVACGRGSIMLTELQPSGSRRMNCTDLLNARSQWFQPDTLLS